jgi:probable rRNA maturation factor
VHYFIGLEADLIPKTTLKPIIQTSVSLQFGSLANAAELRKVLTRARVQKWVQHALHSAGEITVRIEAADEAQRLNKLYRKKDYATNVLTFDYAIEPVVMADLVLCADVVAREAAEQGKSLEAHYAHLIVHGTLHAQGYDHETNEKDAFEMEALEILLLGALGYPNPY